MPELGEPPRRAGRADETPPPARERPRHAAAEATGSGEKLAEGLWVSADVTLAVGAIAMGLPERWHTTLVGLVFFAATWALVWRKDDEHVRRAGLALGGAVIPGRLRIAWLLREAAVACGWAFGATAVVAAPFFFGWRAWWSHATPLLAFSLALDPMEAANELLGQVFVIALPEEAFYRGYLQTRLDEVWLPRWGVFGARVGPGLLASAGIFALGHIVTVHLPTRLAVFFPALVFGWLRARTGGIGASVAFHVICNLYSQMLGRGYGVY